MGRSIRYGEAIALIDELQREFGSHLNADLHGWDFAVGYGEVMAGLHASGYLNVHSETSVKLPWPWPDDNRAPVVTAEEREQLKQRLLRYSAFAS